MFDASGNQHSRRHEVGEIPGENPEYNLSHPSEEGTRVMRSSVSKIRGYQASGPLQVSNERQDMDPFIWRDSVSKIKCHREFDTSANQSSQGQEKRDSDQSAKSRE
jgi:hypothetical protein